LSQIVVGGITGEAILIGLHLSNINKEDGVLSAVFYSLKEWRKLHVRRIHNSSITALLRAIR
jgi:hypothetical protein